MNAARTGVFCDSAPIAMRRNASSIDVHVDVTHVACTEPLEESECSASELAAVTASGGCCLYRKRCAGSGQCCCFRPGLRLRIHMRLEVRRTLYCAKIRVFASPSLVTR